MKQEFELSISSGEFRSMALDRLSGIVQAISVKADLESGSGFVDRTAPTLIIAEPPEQILAAIVASATVAEGAHLERLSGLAIAVEAVGRPLLSSGNAVELLGSYYKVIAFEAHWLGRSYAPSDNIRIMADARSLELEVDAIYPLPHEFQKAEKKSLERTVLLAELMSSASRHRLDSTEPSADVLAANEFGYHLLERGITPPRAFRGIGVYGFRPYQTNLSLADPGDDHVRTTSVDTKLLKGVFVHIEYIDRESKNPHEIEPYRIPSMKWIARTRLHIGPDAPCSVFIGRPMWDTGSVDRDMLKTVHTLAAACTGVFAYGAAECKIAIEGMTARQAVRLMRGLVGNVLRDSALQYFSAAFNINTPLEDDRGDGPPIKVTDPVDIARLGVALAVAGGFEKVTWDGASEALSSKPFTDQISFADLVDLTHEAHSLGLETYISAGMKAEHMVIATEAGVDGVGIGTNMHYVKQDASSKRMGTLKPEAILAALNFRDQAATKPLGRAAKLLARLDRLAFERRLTGGLSAPIQLARESLFAALRARNVDASLDLLSELAEWEALPDAEGHPHLARAQRMLELTSTTLSLDSVSWLSQVSGAANEADTAELGALFATADKQNLS